MHPSNDIAPHGQLVERAIRDVIRSIQAYHATHTVNKCMLFVEREEQRYEWGNVRGQKRPGAECARRQGGYVLGCLGRRVDRGGVVDARGEVEG